MPRNNTRPLSPHLQIYKLPITALVSIGHRAAGIANSLAIALLVWILATAAGDADGFQFTEAILNSWFGRLVLFGFTMSLYFHLCNGIRHLFWDFGKGFDLQLANKSANVCIIAALALTTITWLIAGTS